MGERGRKWASEGGNGRAREEMGEGEKRRWEGSEAEGRWGWNGGMAGGRLIAHRTAGGACEAAMCRGDTSSGRVRAAGSALRAIR